MTHHKGLLALSIAAAVAAFAATANAQGAVPSRLADEPAQVAQLQAAGSDPRTIEDKLFILWEYGGALREVALAEVVLQRAEDPDVKALGRLVRDGHQLGMDIMRPIAAELGITLPEGPTRIEAAAIEAAAKLPPAELERFFLRRQRAMHAWDITVFDDYGAAARNEALKRYVAATRAPLRKHAEEVVRLANRKGIPGALTVISP